jgi:hypothetical protein
MAFSTKLTGLLVLLGTVYLASKFMTCDDAKTPPALPEQGQPDSSSGHIVDSVHLSFPGGLTIGGNAKVVTLPASSGRNIVASQQVDLNGKLEIGGNATVRELSD